MTADSTRRCAIFGCKSRIPGCDRSGSMRGKSVCEDCEARIASTGSAAFEPSKYTKRNQRSGRQKARKGSDEPELVRAYFERADVMAIETDLPPDLRPSFRNLVTDYRAAMRLAVGFPFVNATAIAELVRLGWRITS